MKYLISLGLAASVLSGCGQRNEAPAAADTPAPAAVTPAATASAQLSPTQGNTANGSITLTPGENGVQLSGSISGLAPNGEFGFHVHEKGDCSAPDASSAGDHFNPANAQHGSPTGDTHHAGDMYNVKSDAQGVARVEAQAAGVTLGSGQSTDVLDKAVVLHEKADDFMTQPSGNSGARIACGVITAASS